MKVAVTTVGTKGLEDKSKNEVCINASTTAMEKAKSLGAEVLILPAGFLVVGIIETRQELADSLIDKARSSNIAVIFGVDDSVDNTAYGYAWKSSTESYCWDQRSSNRKNQWDVSDQRCDEARLLRLNSGNVGVLLCGELFNERIRRALYKEPKPKIVVDLVHNGRGFRPYSAMKELYQNGIASACSAHSSRIEIKSFEI